MYRVPIYLTMRQQGNWDAAFWEQSVLRLGTQTYVSCNFLLGVTHAPARPGVPVVTVLRTTSEHNCSEHD